MTPEQALSELAAAAEPGRAEGMAAYHKVPRRYIGVPNGVLDTMARDWRQGLEVSARVDLAAALWATDIYEARIVAAKLLTQARIRDDSAVWSLISGWVPDFDSWAIADHAMMAGQKRLIADPSRLDEVERWTGASSHWTRRAAMVITLPWTRIRHPKPADIAVQERVLGWAAGYVHDPEWFIQKSVAWWLRDLSRHDPDRVRAFLAEHGRAMKRFARREATKHLPESPSGAQ